MAPGQIKDLIMAMHSSVENRLFAKFAGHTLSEAGKLSFKERDVSYFFVLPILSNSVSAFAHATATYRTIKLSLSAAIDTRRNTFFGIFSASRPTEGQNALKSTIRGIINDFNEDF